MVLELSIIDLKIYTVRAVVRGLVRSRCSMLQYKTNWVKACKKIITHATVNCTSESFPF